MKCYYYLRYYLPCDTHNSINLRMRLDENKDNSPMTPMQYLMTIGNLVKINVD